MRGLNTALALWATTASACGGAPLVDHDDRGGAPHRHAAPAPQALQAPPPAPQATPAPARPDPAAGKPVSLEELLAFADRNAPELAVAASTRARADAARVDASPLLPDEPFVSVATGPRRARGGGTAGWDIEVGLQQRVEIAGQRGTRRAAAERLAERVEAEIAASRWQVHQRVHLAFHSALVARERVAAATQLHAFNSRLLEVANKRLAAGDISRLQVRVAEAERAIALERKIAAEQEYLAARLSLAEVSGWPADRPPAPAGTLDPPRKAPPADRLIALARARHPALVALRKTVAEAEAARRVAGRAAWPDLTLGASVAREPEVGPGGGDVEVALFSLGLPLPLFRQNRGERARAEADVRVARSERDAEAAVLDSRVRRAASAVDAAAERVLAYGSEIVPRFQENLDLLVRAFELGEVDVLNVLVARERFLEVQQAVLDSYADYYRAAGALEAEVGAELWPEDRHEHEVKP
jgi:outer membrane protein, heavy metal efflux system